MASQQSERYHPKDALGPAVKAGWTTGVVGAIFTGVQASLTKQNIGVGGTIRRFGGTTAIFASTGLSYVFVRNVTANLREKDDHLSSALGGFVAGSLIGLAKRTVPAVLGMGTTLAILTGVMTYTGGSLRGPARDPFEDRVAEKDRIRKTFRRPVEETIAELGEGRGIYGPGYKERRAQRIKEAYGIDVPS